MFIMKLEQRKFMLLNAVPSIFNFYLNLLNDKNHTENPIFPETSDSLVVTWSTWNLTETVGHFGLSTSNLTFQVFGKSVVFKDGGPEKRKQFIHTVTLKPLTSNTQYCKKLINSFPVSFMTLFTYTHTWFGLTYFVRIEQKNLN